MDKFECYMELSCEAETADEVHKRLDSINDILQILGFTHEGNTVQRPDFTGEMEDESEEGQGETEDVFDPKDLVSPRELGYVSEGQLFEL